MATVFDFAPLEWLGKPELETPVDVDFDALAAMLGIDPISGKPAAKSRPTGNRVARAAAPLSNRVGVRANLGATFGSEGMRQRPLAGWSRSR
jgi:hypothetical protein